MRLGTIKPLNFLEFKSRAAVAESERYISADERDQHNEIKAELSWTIKRNESRMSRLSPLTFPLLGKGATTG